jgi:hypothetical protein
METDDPGTVSGCERLQKNERPWTLPFVLVAAIAIAGVLLTMRQVARKDAAEQGGGWTPAPVEAGQTVSLAIDFGNGARRELAGLPWKEGMTVADVMQAARDFQPGVRFSQQGEGDMALLTSLDGVANDAAIGRFWLYDVNGKPGEVSFAMQKVNAGQRVQWTYGTKPAE